MIIFVNRHAATKLFCLILFIFICSCESFTDNQYIPERYEILSDDILNKMKKKLSRKFQMTPIGEGGSFYDCVRELFIAFNIRGPLNQDQLRIILVSCVEDMLAEVNDNEEIRPYLKVYPFTPKEIKIRLFIIDKLGREVYDPNIGVATAGWGEIDYKTTDKNDTFKYKSTIIESYEDAFGIVETKKNSHE